MSFDNKELAIPNYCAMGEYNSNLKRDNEFNEDSRDYVDKLLAEDEEELLFDLFAEDYGRSELISMETDISSIPTYERQFYDKFRGNERFADFFQNLDNSLIWKRIVFSEEIQNDIFIVNDIVEINEEFIYESFFNEDIINDIVSSTNNYMRIRIVNENVTTNSRLKAWINTTPSEIRTFVGILLYTGVVCLRTLEEYWSSDELFGGYEINKYMTKDRFRILLSNVHFCEQIEIDSKVRKIELFIRKMNTLFQKYALLTENLVVDESLIPFKGRIRFRQYIPSKSAKYGIKLYRLSASNGYVIKNKLYEGKEVTVERGQLQTKTLVEELVTNYSFKGHSLYIDNFFTSIPLAESLLDMEINTAGTLRSNRGIPEFLKNLNLAKGEFIGISNSSNINLYKWKSNRDVYFLSTKHKLDIFKKKIITKNNMKFRLLLMIITTLKVAWIWEIS